jgi:LPXTG-motif cell wall-anchored protein
MKIFASRLPLIALLALVSLCGAIAPGAHADQMNKKTTITFSEPVQVPGMTLPAGTYVFQVMNSAMSKHVVQIWSADGQKLITTCLAINDSKTQPVGKTVITYDERPDGQPMAIKEWFYPGDNGGQEFVYPKTEALQLAQVNHYDVPAAEEPYTPPAPEPEAEQPAPAPAPEPQAAPEPAPAPQPEATPAPQPLPQTGSEAPLVALIGFLSLGAFVGLRSLRRRLS